MRHPKELRELEISEFLIHRAAVERVASPTQSQALSALLFLHRVVLRRNLGDLRNGLAGVSLPDALAQKYPNAEREWVWQYSSPAQSDARDPRSDLWRRHHIQKTFIQRAVRTGQRVPASGHGEQSAAAMRDKRRAANDKRASKDRSGRAEQLGAGGPPQSPTVIQWPREQRFSFQTTTLLQPRFPAGSGFTNTRDPSSEWTSHDDSRPNPPRRTKLSQPHSRIPFGPPILR
jgi:hypothetical protein